MFEVGDPTAEGLSPGSFTEDLNSNSGADVATICYCSLAVKGESECAVGKCNQTSGRRDARRTGQEGEVAQRTDYRFAMS